MSIAVVAGMIAAGGCEVNLIEPEDGARVELGVSPTMGMTTKSIISGTDGSALGKIAVYASGTGYGDGNNYAVYAYSSSAWSSEGTDKIYLSNEEAKVTAHYPAYQSGSGAAQSGSALKASGGSISVSTLASGSIDASGNGLLADAGETDYMYAGTVSYGSGSAATNRNPQVTLTMKHALARVSFRVYKDASYTGTGSLTKVVLKNTESNTALDKGTSPTMNISDGTITMGTAAAASYERTVSNYTVGTDKDNAKALSMLVFPITGLNAEIAKKIQVVFTVDGVDYPVAVTAPTGNAWAAGNNYLYTAKLSGTELQIVSVTLVDWVTETISGDLEIK